MEKIRLQPGTWKKHNLRYCRFRPPAAGLQIFNWEELFEMQVAVWESHYISHYQQAASLM